MKKNVYFAQINVTYSDRIAYLPYSAGCIASYVFDDSEINKRFSLGELLF